ncbi:MAG TPA: hypothetical protein VJB94_02050 [Candidatus Nanoarchaeia archaeon]|nr:hypothetical protein [Candidatus Nanoarchaeia archaeon]
MKCHICSEKIEELFLDKFKGTYINKKPVCNSCQKKYKLEELQQKTK